MSAGSSRIRQRKVSLKNTIKVVYEKDLDDVANIDYVKDGKGVETGVEKHEEQEVHLQQILSQNAALPSKRVYIPTPSASTSWPDYEKYYDKHKLESKSYIRQSATVEDCSGCAYNMDEADDEFLSGLNKDKDSEQACSEDEFEMIIYLFESTIAQVQPFLSTDPSQLLAYKDLEAAVLKSLSAHERDPASLDRLLSQLSHSVFTPKWRRHPSRAEHESLELFGAQIYEHYRPRKIERGGDSLVPQLRFETNSPKDDLDPYVCFRRRESRQSRKTRRTDQQSSERLRRLQAEMRQGKLLFEMVAKREQLKLDALQLDLEVFEQQCAVKAAKRKAKIAGGDDEDLLTAFQKRVVRRLPSQPKRQAEAPKAEPPKEKVEPVAAKPERRAPPKVPSSKIPDLDHLTLEQVALEREEALNNVIRTKLRARDEADHGWVNKTDDPFVPWVGALGNGGSERDDLYLSLNSLYPPPAKRMCLPLAYSLGREHPFGSERHAQVVWGAAEDAGEGAAEGEIKVRAHTSDAGIAADDAVSFPREPAVALCKRAGRAGMKFVDRRIAPEGPVPERFKFDCDEPESATALFGDPARLNGVERNTQQIRFGSMLLAKSYEYLHEAQQQRQLRLKRKSELMDRPVFANG